MDFEVASFWYGQSLSCVERVCIQSFLDHGYTYHLYVLDLDIDVPDGVIVHDAREIYGVGKTDQLDASRKRAAVYSDVFRIYLMQKTDYVWVDLDIYCVNPLHVNSDYLFGLIRRNNSMNNCVLRLPKGSLALKLIINFLESDVPFPFWLGPERTQKLVDRYQAGDRFTLYDLPWTTTGPSVTRWALNATGEISRGQHWHLYFPRRGFLDPERGLDDYEPDWVRFHHFQGETRSNIRAHYGGLPPEGSYIDVVCKRHGIDPARYPVI
ncbi:MULTISPECIES: hypothetical protein [unclassified Ruegeria]|uniref:hypothetical protein n=1 Tax=unclassified Ruegeria TaxID=2625375 RepID=UPI001489C229|nr:MULTISPECIES: hypothetical protein [unclassified Ruegeria]NOD76421.1 hypothetical protein [Ruegeria sp. HKCCD4332]NOD89134.1 hypothetical protein [Ruegeria sp. HKCCD4318]NOE13703.1 hypothetical protein [Ruegeria sp. HKCCD4318-2]NOG07546.1 hypothetical protein [Ruegeria sp. HKCCD4315]